MIAVAKRIAVIAITILGFERTAALICFATVLTSGLGLLSATIIFLGITQ